MSHDHTEDVPKVPLMMLGGLALLALVLAASASFGLVGRDAVPEASRLAAGAQVVASRSLRFDDASDSGVVVFDATTGDQIERIAPGTGGFIRTAMRSMARERQRDGIGAEVPFRLTEWSDGSLSLSDPATGRSFELNAFGKDNRAAFAVLLEGEGA